MHKSKGRVSSANESQPTEKENQKDDHTEAVRRALWKLRAAEREPIVLRYYDDMAYEQIASVLGISQQAVHGRLTRAKRKIKNYYFEPNIKLMKMVPPILQENIACWNKTIA